MKGNSPLSNLGWEWGWVSEERAGGGRVSGQGRKGRLREGSGSAWQGVLSPACQSLLHHFARLFRAQASPSSPCGQSRRLGNGQGGQATACPPQGSQYSPLLLTPENTPQHVYHGGEGRGRRDGGEGESVPLGESTRRMEEQALHTCSCSPSLSVSLLCQIHHLEASAILEAGGLGKRQGVKA